MAVKEKIGIVVSDKMKDTRIVAVNDRIIHKRYKKVITRTRRYAVQDSAFNASVGDNVAFWNDTYPTDTVFTRGSWNAGQEMISYCFHSVEGYSKVGWYIANANGNGPYVHCGFRPAFVMVKNEDNSGEEWVMYDNKRVTSTVNNVGSPNGATLYTGHNYVESDGNASTGGNSRNVSFFSTGFKITDTGNPLNKPSDEGNHHVFFAIAEQPLTTQFGSQSNAQ